MSQEFIQHTSKYVPDFDFLMRDQHYGFRVDFEEVLDGDDFNLHTHKNVEVNFLEAGRLTYFHGGRLQSMSEGQFGVFWAGYPHRIISIDHGSKLWWLTIPLEDFLGWQFSNDFIARIMSGEIITGTKAEPGIDSILFGRWRNEYQLPKFQRIILLEVQARLLRLQARSRKKTDHHVDPNTKGLEGMNPKALQMASHVAQSFSEPITLDTISRHVNLNPSYAARLFKRSFGMSVGRFLEEVRVAHAQNLLKTSSSKVLDIAYSSGFQSSSRFYASFKSITGYQPTEFRNLVLGS